MIPELTIKDFLTGLAAKTATPGGGSVAALNGAMAAALTAMVCRLTLGKPQYADVESPVEAVLSQAEVLQTTLTALIDADTAAFDQVMAAYKLPRQTEPEKEIRTQTIQTALKEATRVPLKTARACAAVLNLAQTISQIGNRSSLSDAGSAAQAAVAGLKSAALNVYINLAGIKDPTFAEQTTHEITTLLSQCHRADEVFKALNPPL